LHRDFASVPEATFYAANLFFKKLYSSADRSEETRTNLHCMGKHSRQSERHLLRKLLAMHGDLKTISEVDMDNLSRASFKEHI
jgi:hypothetical protein